MKVLCLTCFYKRPEVSRIFLEGMKRLGIEVLAVVDEVDEDIALCHEYGIRYRCVQSCALGTKWNQGVDESLTLDWTHLLISGDDNLYSNECLKLWDENTTANFQGLSQIYFIKPYDKLAMKMQYSPEPPIVLGTGRLLNRSLVETMRNEDGNVRLFSPNQNRELDHVQDLMLLEKGFYPTVIDRGGDPLCIDIKTGKNIWSFENFSAISQQEDYSKAISWIGEKERSLLLSLSHAGI